MTSLPALYPSQWLLAVFAAVSIGIAKSGFSGFGLVTVLLMAEIMPARQSTGAVLPLLICGDLLAVGVFRKHAQWRYLVRMLPPALAGIVVGYFAMAQDVPDRTFRSIIATIILLLVALQLLRKWRPLSFEHVPHRRWFAWLVGMASGVTTMLANAAGPIMTLYLLAVKLPKWEFVGTTATFFLIVNLIKVPFSAHLGLINPASLSFNIVLVPAVVLGTVTGKYLLRVIPQKQFEWIVLVFAALATARLIIAS
ncbi:MAG: uncharacterized protein QOD99_417 [Chthoniobacter sp.]|nr:uncharacterized protein [Chthoniobacter sp.]